MGSEKSNERLSVVDRPDRRAVLLDAGLGFGALALSALLKRDGFAAVEEKWRPPDGLPNMRPRAKSVIWLFLRGGMSHLESFDPKPALHKYAGQSITETPFKDVLEQNRLKKLRVVAVNISTLQNSLFAPQVGFRKYGKSGIEVSDWFPHLGRCVDDLAVVRSMWTTDDNHGAQVQFHSGRHMLDGQFPTIGAWISYGLGSLSENLPQFISMGPQYFQKSDGSYLGPAYDPVPLKVNPANPLAFAQPEFDHSPAEQEAKFRLIDRLNQLTGQLHPDDQALEARIKSYELAFRMQTAVPEAVDFASESKATHELYGLSDDRTRDFGLQLLAARRFVERGVRFVQIMHGEGAAGSWDAHENLVQNHSDLAAQVDKPIAGLLLDLKQRGMLDETIVVLATEFGRTPGSQRGNGRDHHPFGFSVCLAGGGIKGGITHGATDEIGFHAVEHPHYVTDIHATILHQLGLDAHRLEVPGHKRLEIDFGHPIHQIIA